MQVSRAFALAVLALAVLDPVAARGAAPAAETADRVVLDRIVAVVDDEVILESDLDREVQRSERLANALSALPNPTEADVARIAEEIRPAVLDDLVDQLLVLDEGARFQIQATDADLERYLQNLATGHGYATVEALREDVERSGIYGTWEDYTNDLRKQIVVYKTLATLAAPTVSEAQIRAYYRSMTKDVGARVVVERFRVAPPSDDPTGRNAAFATAQRLVARLRRGVSAEDAAREVGLPPPKREEIRRGDMVVELEDAVFAAKDGSIVGPVETGRGFEVVRVIEHKASEAVPFEEAKERITEVLYAKAAEKAEREFKQGLRARAHIDIRL
ncbi:MAG: hypothetical protein D6705_08195 [Deltaproteobacteria bacterium]|nr:MAG: hypothetical protein D6705_08195 [Deltaproteobacteria bacterium]